MAQQRGILNRLGNKIAPPRFLLFVAILLAGAAALYLTDSRWADSLVLAFDAAALVFLISLWPLMGDCGADKMREHSQANDANRALVLGITIIVTIAIMATIAGELKGAKSGDTVAIAKLIGTLACAWLFTNSVFFLHYAHVFYSQATRNGGDTGGIDFPGTKEPDYWDFLYFSFTLGMTFQTSDVDISSGAVRRIVVFHCLLAFVFNIGVIAFTINALGGGGG